MKLLRISTLSENDKNQILKLWNNEYPERLSYSSIHDFENYLNGLLSQSHILLVDKEGGIKGWYFSFIRDNEKWFGLIVGSSVQGKGWGTKMLNLAQTKENQLNGWVIDQDNEIKRNGTVYKSPLRFYLANDFKVVEGERLETEKISAVKIRWIKH